MSCKWDRDTEDYLNNSGEPCRVDDYGDPTNHCTARRTCGNHIGLGELTCARCIGRTRANLRRLPLLATLMMPVALGAGVNSEAANMAGPAADVEAWTWRKIAARQGRAWHISLTEDDDELHPYTVLTRWQMMIAEGYSHDLPPVLSITGAADYLARQLGRIAQDPEQEFTLLAREIRRSVQHLEAVMANSDAQERGAPCPDCTNEHTGVGPRLVRKYAHWCEHEDCAKFHYDTDEADRWVCPRNPDHWRSVEDYNRYLTERRGA